MIITSTVEARASPFVENETAWHSTRPSSSRSSTPREIDVWNYKQPRQDYVDGLIELGPRNPVVLVLDSAVANATTTCNFETSLSPRFLNRWVQGGNMMSVAAGLARKAFFHLTRSTEEVTVK